MRNFLIVVVLILAIVVGLPLFMNWQESGNVYGDENGLITAVAGKWLELFNDIGGSFGSSIPSPDSRF